MEETELKRIELKRLQLKKIAPEFYPGAILKIEF
jgi:hypothetical protein